MMEGVLKMYVNKTEYEWKPKTLSFISLINVIVDNLHSMSKTERVYEDNKLIYRSASVR